MERQQPNTSLLSPNKFRVVLTKFKDTNWFCQKISVPDLTCEPVVLPTNSQYSAYFPGNIVSHSDLTLTLTVNEDLTVLRDIKAWMEEDVTSTEEVSKKLSQVSIITLTNNGLENVTMTFHDAFPVALTGLALDTTQPETEVFTCDVTFKFTKFTISKKE